MANRSPAQVNITSVDINGNSVLKVFNNVKNVNYDFFENTVNVVDASGSFYFGYSAVVTVTHVITNGVTVITIS